MEWANQYAVESLFVVLLLIVLVWVGYKIGQLYGRWESDAVCQARGYDNQRDAEGFLVLWGVVVVALVAAVVSLAVIVGVLDYWLHRPISEGWTVLIAVIAVVAYRVGHNRVLEAPHL